MIGNSGFDDQLNKKIQANAPLNQKKRGAGQINTFNEGMLEKSDIIQNEHIPGPLQMDVNKRSNAAEIPHEERLAKIVDLKSIKKELKTYRTNRSKDQIREQSRQLMNIQANNLKGSKKSQLANAELVKNSSELLLRDKKWTRFFFAKESPEMIAVKQSVAYLNNLLDGEVQTTGHGEKEKVDVKYLLDTIIPAYQTAFDACDTYIKKRESEGAKKGYGLRRLQKVKDMLISLRNEITDMKLVVESIQNTEKVGFTENEDVLGNQIIDTRKMSVRHLVGEVVRRKAVVCKFIPEGNSSNTYRVKVEGEDDKYYYVKKEEPLLNENLPGYLENRLKELNRSKNIKQDNQNKHRGRDYIKGLDDEIASLDKAVLDKKIDEQQADKRIQQIRAQREELRLENILDMKDYEYGIRLLTTMQSKVNSLGGADKEEQIQRYVKFFAHDFDGFFDRLEEYNALVEKYKNNANQIDELINTLKAKNGKNVKQQVADLERLKQNGIKQMNELEWIEAHKKELGIEGGNGEELMTILREMGSDQADQHRISKLFQRTLGKEAELFGQQASRSGTTGSDVLAANNTASSRLAKRYNFADVVTSSKKSKLDMVEVGTTEDTLNNVTMSEEAPGEELLQICEDAKRLQKQQNISEPIVQFSSDAIRDLSRMHTFDLMTCQTDRHWRNIKSSVKKQVANGKQTWIVQNAKCYDHDQSLGTKDLREYFKDEKNDVTGEVKTVSEGFLKPIMMTVSKTSSIYKYAVQNKMTNPQSKKQIMEKYNGFLDKIDLPKSKTRSLDQATALYKERQKTPIKKDQYTIDPEQMTQRILTTFGWEETIEHEYDEEIERKERAGEFVTEEESRENRRSKRQKDILDALAKRNPQMATKEGREKCARFFELMYKLCYATSEKNQIKIGYYKVVDTFLFDSKAELDKAKSKMKSDADRSKCMLRKNFIKEFRELQSLYESFDFTHLEEDADIYAPANFTGKAHTVGYYDYTFQSVFHLLKLKLQENPAKTNNAIKELVKEETEEKKANYEAEVVAEAKKHNRVLSKKEKEEAIKKKQAEDEADTVRVPAILHMDYDAYMSIKSALKDEKELDNLLMDLELTKEKKEALRKRLQQIIDDADEAAKVVNKWADMKGLPPEAIERKFLLTKAEFKKIKSLTDMALDPGQSYFSVEDSQFMTGNDMMQKYITTADREVSKKITNEERGTRRQKMELLGKDETYTSYVSNNIAS
jgi:hypothetical protein